ncbi:DNA repair helicase [Panus rudis PR-1116 ss-1]|nr:DNA repair helicase [Panus rudis PR-1116 ss-1]
MSLKLSTPDSFPAFPFLPYGIQLNLMKHLYEAIEESKVTIIESPTGTGKTLSLLCASLTWLQDEQDRAKKGKIISLDGEDDSMNWVAQQTAERQRRQLEAEEEELMQRLQKAKQREQALRKAARLKNRKKMKSTNVVVELDDAMFLPETDDSHLSDEENLNISPEVRALMKKLEHPKASTTDAEPDPTCTKVYYASRTHSQLSQVLHELKKLRIDLSFSSVTSIHPKADTMEYSANIHRGPKRSISALEDDDENCEPESANVRCVPLGSRKQLCINDKLKAKAGDLDEACRQRLNEKGDRRCEFLPPLDEETRMLDFRDQILATPKDIEDLVTSGQHVHTCPYFGSRRAIPQAQLVMLPYNLLLQKTARESLGIDLSGQVVVIDEAHNLISTLLSLSTVQLPLRTLMTSLNQLNIYVFKFRNRLSAVNLLHLKRLVGLLESLQKYAEEWKEQQNQEGNSKEAEAQVLTSGELLRRLGRKVEGINLLEIEGYLRKSKIARKISGYCVKELEKAAGSDPVKLSKLSRLSNTTPPLHLVESFIVALTAASDDGRVTFLMNEGQVEIKYQHLNPATCFQDVVDLARSVVLAGGTMSPISDVVNQLFTGLPSERLSTFSCGHIIPASNLQTLVLKKGPRGGDLQFKYDRRNDQGLIGELGQIMLNFANVIPSGMVVFVPSYSFLTVLTSAWEKSGVLDKLRSKKKVFLEPQDSSAVESVLREYAAQIQDPDAQTVSGNGRKSGALLFAVIGAKLSEGLNFTDDLARGVIIIGLPFANLASPELRERMQYVNRVEQARGIRRPPGAKDAATELYENMCMNAVNQSIGRAIRHRNDWASLVLIDARYSSPRIRAKLPKWIGEKLTVTETFGEAMKQMGQFYREKKAKA